MNFMGERFAMDNNSIFPEAVGGAKKDTARILPAPYTVILNDQINVVSLIQSEQIIAQMRLSSSEMYFFDLLYKSFPEYVVDKDIHLSSGSIRKHILPSLRKKMRSFVPHLYLLRIKGVGYMLKLDPLVSFSCGFP
jgi:hypothetical protein